MNPKVSIIVPVYNVEKYLDQCVQSLVNQTLKEIEIILVDDESPDHCGALCDEYARKDSRIKVVHKKNGGLGFARNSGLEEAIGEFVAFVDSDDFVDLTMYETLYKKIVEDNLDTCYSGFAHYLPDGKIQRKVETDIYQKFIGRKEVDAFLLDMVGPDSSCPFEVKYMMSTCKVLYNLALIRKYNIKFHSEREFVSEDMIFNIDYLCKAQNVGFLPNHFYFYRINPTSLSHTWKREKFDRNIVYLKEVNRKLSALYPIEKYKKHFYRQCFLYLRTSVVTECASLQKEGISKQMQSIKDLVTHPYFDGMLKNYDFGKLPLKKRILFAAFKYRLYVLVYLFYKITH